MYKLVGPLVFLLLFGSFAFANSIPTYQITSAQITMDGSGNMSFSFTFPQGTISGAGTGLIRAGGYSTAPDFQGNFSEATSWSATINGHNYSSTIPAELGVFVEAASPTYYWNMGPNGGLIPNCSAACLASGIYDATLPAYWYSNFANQGNFTPVFCSPDSCFQIGTFTINRPGKLHISFTEAANGSWYLKEAQYSTVPEPATLALVGTGLGALGFWKRKILEA